MRVGTVASPPRWKPENCSWGPQKHPQDRSTPLLKPLFWHAKHAQNAPAKFVPDTIGLKDFLDYALAKGAVWFAKRIDIANWWLAHHEEFKP